MEIERMIMQITYENCDSNRKCIKIIMQLHCTIIHMIGYNYVIVTSNYLSKHNNMAIFRIEFSIYSARI